MIVDVILGDLAGTDASPLPWVEGSEGRPVQAGNIVMQGQVHDKPMKGSKDEDDEQGNSGLQSNQRGDYSQGLRCWGQMKGSLSKGTS